MGLNQTTFDDKEKTLVYPLVSTSENISRCIANEIAETIIAKAKEGQKCVLGLATGSSPLEIYAELINLHKKKGLSFKNVITFNLDEYNPIEKKDHNSYWYFMHENLFNHIDIPSKNINIPSGTLKPEEVDEYCKSYENKIKEAGGIDIQLLGIGRTGHIGFNEPGSELSSITRKVILNEITRVDAAPAFDGIENVPTTAITMGVNTIMNAKKIFLFAWGKSKASIIKKTLEGDITSEIPATYLQNHDNVAIYLDNDAASELSIYNDL